jgi:hypothetical protein
MKKNLKLAFAAFALLAFTACGNDNAGTTEAEGTDATESTVDTDMDTNLDEDTTIVVQDTTVDDGVADDLKEEQPPVQ